MHFFFHLLALCREGSCVTFYHPFKESDCSSSQGWGLKQEVLPLPVPSGTCFFIPQPHRLVFLSLLEQKLCAEISICCIFSELYFPLYLPSSPVALRPTRPVLRLL